MLKRLAALVAACALAVATDASQARAQASCPPTAPTPDSVTLLLSIDVRPADPALRLSRDFLAATARAVALAIGIPAPLGMAAYVGHRMPGDEGGRVSGAHVDIDATYELTIRPGRRAGGVRVLTTSLNADLDSAVVEAVHDADSVRAFPDLSQSLRMDSVAVVVVLAASDSARARGLPISRSRVPLRHYDAQVVPLASNAEPRYPDELRARRIEGRVDVSFVVDEKGAIVPGTISVRRTTDPGFVTPVIDALAHDRFIPALVDGCTVPARVGMPFVFTLPR